MLRIHEVTSASHAKAYYAASDYYTEGQEVAGEFMGKLASKLGLTGKVDKASFDALCDNLNPKTGKPLTPRTNDERRVGKDFVFSGPKSFSIAEALASEEERQRLLGAFNDAITETLVKDIEPDVQTRVRADGADEDRTTGNLLAAGFDHSTARPVGDAVPDMHRHKHLLVFNATYDPVEQRIKAGQFGNIKRDAEY
jgi:conjugative relaxase-like TrwC/TraI family protein